VTPAAFVSKWNKVSLSERSAYQQHFLDLCDLVGHPKPAEVDPTGDWFCFERGTDKHGGGEGWADVWKRGAFAFEYKGRHKNLARAFDQLLLYRASLENPPLLVVCDTDLIEIHTNFTGTREEVHRIRLADLDSPAHLATLRALFHEPDALRPGQTAQAVTETAAAQIGEVARSMRDRQLDGEAVARFLDRVVFCLFAEDVGLLPNKVFSTILDRTAPDPARFRALTSQLFAVMATGGDFGTDEIRHFNGDLFTDSPALEPTPAELAALRDAARLDWASVDPSIFGTLFQRGLDPALRSALGAEYTGRTEIEELVEAVILAPLRNDWRETRDSILNLVRTGKKRPKSGEPVKPPTGRALEKALEEAGRLKHAFLQRLARVHVLDPACGSGNFLYVALQMLKDLEKEVLLFAGEEGVDTSWFPAIGPWQFHGLEINPYAFELAQVTLWIGYLQWHRGNGYPLTATPLLRRLEGFRLMDAILDRGDGSAPPTEPEWPWRADWELYVVGNPPFLGGKMQRRQLGDDTVAALHRLWAGRVPAEADLCCYWFEKARAGIENGRIRRAGLLATQAIRGGANREVLARIRSTGGIFFAVSDRPWILDGAAVHISMIGFDNGAQTTRTLDGHAVPEISASLTAGADQRDAAALAQNLGLAFMGVTPAGPFDIPIETAREWLTLPNPHGKPNSDVLRPYFNGRDLNQRPSDRWTIDFFGRSEAEAALYEKPFEWLVGKTKQLRQENTRQTNKSWWLHERPRVEMRRALEGAPCYLATARVAKHRLFTPVPACALPDCQLIIFARSDDLFLGVLHSRFHEVWALAQGTQLREKESGFRYTPTTCFETFPLPEPTAAQAGAIAAAARELNALRERWLNPPEWVREEVLEFPATAGGPWSAFMAPAEPGTIGTARYPRRVPADAKAAAELKRRTLTALYNARPEWLRHAHARLDAAVAGAYGLAPDLPDADLLARLLELNRARANP